MPAQPGPRQDQLAQRSATPGNVLTAGILTAPDPLAAPSYQPTSVVLGPSVVLDSTATNAQINTALTNFDIVYLRPGTYNNISAAGPQIVVPVAKQLIGLTGGEGDYLFSVNPTVNPIWAVTGTTASSLILLNEGSVLKGFTIDGISVTVSNGAHHVVEQVLSVASWTIINEMQILSWGLATSAAALRPGRSHISDCLIANCGRGILLGSVTGTGAENKRATIERCYITNSGPAIEASGSTNGNSWHILRVYIKLGSGTDDAMAFTSSSIALIEIAHCFINGGSTSGNTGIRTAGTMGSGTRIYDNHFVNFGSGSSAILAAAGGTNRAWFYNNAAAVGSSFTIGANWRAFNNFVAT